MARSGIETVLLPTDLAGEFDLMLRFAEGLGRAGTECVLVSHVAGPAGSASSPKAEEARLQLERRVAHLREAGVRAEVRVTEGEPTESLMGVAREADADAVFVGTHGKSVEERLAEGSVSEALAMSAHLPVGLVRFDLLQGDGKAPEIAASLGKVMLVPTDFSASAGRAQAFACRLANRNGGLVRLLTVVDDGKRPTPALEDLRARCKAAGTRTSIVTRVGDPAEQVLAEAAECGATSVVMGTRGRSAAGEELLGSVSLSVARGLECPVVIVP